MWVDTAMVWTIAIPILLLQSYGTVHLLIWLWWVVVRGERRRAHEQRAILAFSALLGFVILVLVIAQVATFIQN
jgi:hypothetical protein